MPTIHPPGRDEMIATAAHAVTAGSPELIEISGRGFRTVSLYVSAPVWLSSDGASGAVLPTATKVPGPTPLEWMEIMCSPSGDGGTFELWIDAQSGTVDYYTSVER